MVITAVRHEALDLGVQKGWVVKSIGGEAVEAWDFKTAYEHFKQAIEPLKAEFLVRDCPVDDASVSSMSAKVGPVEPSEVPAFLKRYGYHASSDSTWDEGALKPDLLLGVIDGHREKGIPVAHTWYALQGRFTPASLRGMEATHSTRWQVERRLAHLRSLLHQPVKRELAKEYDTVFANAHFAHHAGPPGTTNRLEAWLRALCKIINSGQASPSLVALTLRFLEAPDIEEANRAQGMTTSGGHPLSPAAARDPGSPQAPQADAPSRDLDERTDDGEDGAAAEERSAVADDVSRATSASASTATNNRISL